MTRAVPLLLLAPLVLAASAPVPPRGETLGSALERARAEQASAEIETRRLERVAASARTQVEKLHARQAAAAQAIEVAEARITAADTNLRLISAIAELRRAELRRERQPIESLLSGLAMMARRPPLLALADSNAGADELVKVRVLLDSTLPVIRKRTSGLSAQLAQEQRLAAAAVAAKSELLRSRQDLLARRRQFASLEAEALKVSGAAQGQALASGDIALSVGENVESLKSAEAGSRAAWAIASELAANDSAPARPTGPEGPQVSAPLPYVLPAQARVTAGLGSIDPNGVRSRGLTLETGRGVRLIVPASGTIRFSGPFRSHDGVVIIDHGGGWMSLIVNVASPLKPGDRVRMGDPLGRALGRLGVELSQNGRKVSPALIAGSSRTLSNQREGG